MIVGEIAVEPEFLDPFNDADELLPIKGLAEDADAEPELADPLRPTDARIAECR